MLSEIFPIRYKTSSKDEIHWYSTPLYLRSCQKGNNQCRVLPYEGYACRSHDEGIGSWKAWKMVGIDGSWIVWINYSTLTSSGLSRGSPAQAAATQNLVELSCCKLKKIYALYENFIYSMRHVKRATPPFYSLKVNFCDLIIFSTQL